MDERRRHVLIGVLASLFATPFVGGGLLSYLEEYTIKSGVIAGAALGGTVGLFFGILGVVDVLFPLYGLSGSINPGSWMMGFFLTYLVGTLILGLVSGMVGGGIGSYVKRRASGESGTLSTT